MSKTDDRDLARAKDLFALARAIRDVLVEASKNFPEGKPKEVKIEWCRVTTKMIVALVKRKGVKYSTMVKQARKEVRRHFEREQARRLMKMEFPEWSPLKPGYPLEPVDSPQEDVEQGQQEDDPQ